MKELLLLFLAILLLYITYILCNILGTLEDLVMRIDNRVSKNDKYCA